MFLGEHTDGTVTEIESRDISFLESNFPKRGEIDRDFTFYEMDEPSGSTEPSDGTQEAIMDLDLSGSKPSVEVNLPLP